MVSVIICTYNRCESLKDVLDSVKAQESSGNAEIEILIVDNNSNDRTRDLVEAYARDFPVLLRYVFEPQQGISLARNRGVNEARGDVLAFVDDDVILAGDWVVNILEFCRRHDFDAAGGRVLPLYPGDTPAWVLENRDILRGPILCHDFGPEIRPYDESMDPFVGANLVVPRATFTECGLFNTDIVRGQDTLGEDTELFFRLSKAGKRLMYCGTVCIRHKADKNRMNLRYIARWSARAGRFYAMRHYSEHRQEPSCWCGIPRYLFRRFFGECLALIPGVFKRRRFLRVWTLLFVNVGMIQQFRRNHRRKH